MTQRATIFSACRQYRYVLWREWNSSSSKYVMFIGLNPSTADETNNDPTIRRCIAFARTWGYGAVCVTNLFAYRATQLNNLKTQLKPVGAENDAWLLRVAQFADLIVAGWGVNGTYQGRNEQVLQLLSQTIMCLRETRTGQPWHPLYLRRSVKPQLYRAGRIYRDLPILTTPQNRIE
jgi:hypothetical protein